MGEKRQKRRRIPEAQAAGEQFWQGEFGEFLFKEGEFLAPLPKYLLERMWEERLEWHEERMRMDHEDIQYEAANESESGGERIMRPKLRKGSASAMRISRSSRPTVNPSTKPPSRLQDAWPETATEMLQATPCGLGFRLVPRPAAGLPDWPRLITAPPTPPTSESGGE